LLALTKELSAHLTVGGTLVVPTAQRAAAVRIAFTHEQLRAGRAVWSSPDVLPWSAWLDRGLDEARGRGVPVPRRLSRTQEWWLWRAAVRAACDEFAVLSPDSLIESVRRAVLALEDHGIELRDVEAAETAVLLAARAHFSRRCAALHALWSQSWSACAPYIKSPPATRLAGFADVGAARRRWLEGLGLELQSALSDSELPATGTTRSYAEPELEAAGAAQWCAAQLRADPAARLLIVVPRLGEQRHRWERALSQRLDYGALLEGVGTPADGGAYATEGGQPLSEYAMAAVALDLLRLAAGEADFSTLSAVLRSCYLDPDGHAARLELDVWLRQQNFAAPDSRRLHLLLDTAGARPGEQAAAALRRLLEALNLSAPAARAAPRATPSDWARRFADWLARCGWPGTALCSDEQQVRMRFEELLGEFAGMEMDGGTLPLASAVQLLRQLAVRTAFEPATDDVPVTLTSSLEDPIVRYDGIWIAGLTADAWPAPMRPDPLIPWGLQRAAALPMASPEGALRSAENAMQRWRQATDDLVFSYASSDGDLPRHASPLLPAGSAAEEQGFELESWLASQAPLLEIWCDPGGPAWPIGQSPRGGTWLLESQALCPFRGFALLRLRAEPLSEPEPGIDPRLRGKILHAALEHFWRQLADSGALHALGVQGAIALARESIAHALGVAQRRASGLLDPQLLRREAARDERLLELLIVWELAREPFAIEMLERSLPLELAGTRLGVRLDRVDRLTDGQLIVIDYKSGDPASFDALADRLTQPQLPAYATVAGARTAAVAMLHLGREGLALRGAADAAGRLTGLRPLKQGQADWPMLLERWRVQLAGLVQEFQRGHAAVDPQPKACDHCHLQVFCRVQTALVPTAPEPSPQAMPS
jgi:ATP-dependent helicase/nuclease subunit B